MKKSGLTQGDRITGKVKLSAIDCTSIFPYFVPVTKYIDDPKSHFLVEILHERKK